MVRKVEVSAVRWRWMDGRVGPAARIEGRGRGSWGFYEEESLDGEKEMEGLGVASSREGDK